MLRITVNLIIGLFLTILVSPQTAHAYIGPGLSVGAAIVVLIVIFSILLALYALVWYPLRRRMKGNKSQDEE